VLAKYVRAIRESYPAGTIPWRNDMSTNQRERGFRCGREILTVTSGGWMSPIYWNTEFLDGNWVAEAKQTYCIFRISGNFSEEVQSLISEKIWQVIVVHSIVQGCTLAGNVSILFPRRRALPV